MAEGKMVNLPEGKAVMGQVCPKCQSHERFSKEIRLGIESQFRNNFQA